MDPLGLLDDLEVILYTADGEGRITWITPAVERLLGYSPAEVVGREPEIFLPSAGLERARGQLQRKLNGSARLTIYEVTALGKDGSRVPLQIVSAPLVERGKIVGARGVAVRRSEAIPAVSILTPRQYEVLQLLADGRTTSGIADQLNISVETTRNHIRAVMAALGSSSRLEAVAVARRAGII